MIEGMPTPVPSPIPVVVTNDPSLLEIFTQFAIPSLSLAAAIVAAVGTVFAVKGAKRADERADRAERRAEHAAKERVRADYARRLRDHAREIRDGYPSRQTVHSIGDPWRDLLRDAPDDAARQLVTWIGNAFGDFEHAFRMTDRSRRDQELSNLYGEVESRIEVWMRDGEAPAGPPIAKQFWPAPVMPADIDP